MKDKKHYPIKNLLSIFDLKVNNIEKADLNRCTTSASIHRTGLELAGVYDINKTSSNIIGWGTKEAKYFQSLGLEKAKIVISYVITEKTPLIILSIGMPKKYTKLIVEIASRKSVAVVATDQHLSTLRATIGAELVDYFACETSVHGSLVVVNGVGVMIIGKSGIGKSEAVLELVKREHSFISDDTVILRQVGKSFTGSAAELTKGLLEARGIGLINIPHIYGERLFKESAKVELVLELKLQNEIEEVDRLGNKQLTYSALEGEIPLMQIPVNQGRSISGLIEAAVNVFVARVHGLDPLKQIQERRGK